uniref:Ribosomal silencing factor RsfS n=1 Tax=Pinguiococcus pyrenoidosus TaxID=172671 RepID=A0A7R9YBC2_9STRA|mmetsp:Transcript_15542/g.59074  ORF Transcript_15542/g.59074 Transcript_15542/m.59074 type:complete len:231 (+) Transcript_15542:182-874(+)
MWSFRLLVAFLWLSSFTLGFRRSIHTPRTERMIRLSQRQEGDIGRRPKSSTRKQRRKEQFDSMYAPSERLEPPGPVDEHPSLPLVHDIVRAADARKADNPVVYHVESVTPSNSFMIVCSGNSRPQNQAIAAHVVDEVEEQYGRKPDSRQGTAESGWILLDYGDVIVHVMTPKSRAYYDLEGFWKNGKRLEIEHLLLPNVNTDDRTRAAKDAGGDGAVDFRELGEDDPFWS